MCNFPEFTLKSALNDLAGWAGFNFFFYTLSLMAFSWFTQKYYRGLRADRVYFPSVFFRLLIEFMLLNANTMAVWISYSCKNWDNNNGLVVHSIYVFWSLSFALQLTSLAGPKMIGVAAMVTALTAILSLVNTILAIVYVFNIWSVIIYAVTTVYFSYMAFNLIVVTFWPVKGSRDVSAIIAKYAAAWDKGVECHTHACYGAIKDPETITTTTTTTTTTVETAEIDQNETDGGETMEDENVDFTEDEKETTTVREASKGSSIKNRSTASAKTFKLFDD